MFESLESRRLLTVVLDQGVLRVSGTPEGDRLFVGRREQAIHVSDNGTEHHFPANLVREIAIRGLGGNDRIGIGQGVFRPILASGGEGNDLMDGGSGNERFLGDAGNDRLFGGDGDDALHGGGGDDLLIGGRGHDRMLGGADSDHIDALDRQRDFVDGGDGEDYARTDENLDQVVNVEHETHGGGGSISFAGDDAFQAEDVIDEIAIVSDVPAATALA